MNRIGCFRFLLCCLQYRELLIFFRQVRHLEENGAALADDLIQKSAIIQAYAMETKVGMTETIGV